jgi:hypothetical protein
VDQALYERIATEAAAREVEVGVVALEALHAAHVPVPTIEELRRRGRRAAEREDPPAAA